MHREAARYRHRMRIAPWPFETRATSRHPTGMKRVVTMLLVAVLSAAGGAYLTVTHVMHPLIAELNAPEESVQLGAPRPPQLNLSRLRSLLQGRGRLGT